MTLYQGVPWWWPAPYAVYSMGYRRPVPGPLRQSLVSPLPTTGLTFGPVSHGGSPIYGFLSPFQYAGAPIDPGSLFFRAGNPIGGPSEAFRGVSALAFPYPFSVTGPGAPLSAFPIGLAGRPIGGPGVGGGPIGFERAPAYRWYRAPRQR